MTTLRRHWRWLLALTLLIGTGTGAEAQVLGVQGGLNFATLAGDDVDGADGLTGWQLGGVALLGRGRASLMTALLVTRKGATETVQGLGLEIGLTYLQLPVLARWALSTAGADGSIGTHFYLGPAVAYQAGCRVSISSGGQSASSSCEDSEEEESTTFRKTEVSAIAGFGADYEQFSFSLQYDLGLTSIAEAESVKNRAFSVLVRYFWR